MSSTLILVQQGQASHSPIVAGPIVAGPIISSLIISSPIISSPITAGPIVDDNNFILLLLLLSLLAGGAGVPLLAAPVLGTLLHTLQGELVPALELQTKVHEDFTLVRHYAN